MIKECKKHGQVKHALGGKYYRCTKCRSDAVQRRRHKLKMMAIEYKGGKCQNCGYHRCKDALDFHHLITEEKEFGIGEKGYTRKFETVKKELDKCALLCSNCHREVHAGILNLQGS